MYLNSFESTYASRPDDCVDPTVLFVGTGIGMEAGNYLMKESEKRGVPLSVVLADAGPLDLLCHMAPTRFPRYPVIKRGTERVGGKLTLWGVAAPRPRIESLERWPYETEDLLRRFEAVQSAMGVSDPTPMSGRLLESRISEVLQGRFAGVSLRRAPLAIDRDGRRWCPIESIPDLDRKRCNLLPRFRCGRLVTSDGRIESVHGSWMDGQEYTLRPQYVVLAVGAEASLPLVRQVAKEPVETAAADHIRIDLHGCLPQGSFGSEPVDELGIAVLLMEHLSSDGVACHLAVKIAPKDLWARGFMQSHDNLRGTDDAAEIYVQVQAVAAMHQRLPSSDLLNIGATFPPVMSSRDAEWHGELVQLMQNVAAAVGLAQPRFSLRPLLTNHHCYGAYRVGRAVTKAFQFRDAENLFILPPSSFVDEDDDANPTLKSVVLSQFAMEEILNRVEDSCVWRDEN